MLPSQVRLEFQNVEYAVASGRKLVNGISFEILQGEMLVLLGRSGSGKTTLLKLVNRLLEPTSGEVLVSGRDTQSWDPIQLRRHIGYVIQDVGLFPHFTVARNVGLVPSLEAWPPEKITLRIHEMLRLVGLDPETYGRRYPHELRGQRQRVGARAPLPRILRCCCSMNLRALDPITRSEIQHEFRELHHRLGKTMIFVTHDIREAFLLGTRIGLMQEGRLVALVTPDEFLNLDHAEARAFVGCLQ
jgi:osmoprotectant transport system ATP-binding protein